MQDHTLYERYLTVEMANPGSCQPALHPTSFSSLDSSGATCSTMAITILTQWRHMNLSVAT